MGFADVSLPNVDPADVFVALDELLALARRPAGTPTPRAANTPKLTSSPAWRVARAGQSGLRRLSRVRRPVGRDVGAEPRGRSGRVGWHRLAATDQDAPAARRIRVGPQPVGPSGRADALRSGPRVHRREPIIATYRGRQQRKCRTCQRAWQHRSNEKNGPKRDTPKQTETERVKVKSAAIVPTERDASSGR